MLSAFGNSLDPDLAPRLYNFFSCSTQLSTKFQLLIKTKILYQQMKKFLALNLSDVVFIMLINVKMPTIVGILTFMSKINFMLSCFEHGQSFITSGPDLGSNCSSLMDYRKNLFIKFILK